MKKLILRLLDDCLEDLMKPLSSLALAYLEIDARKVSLDISQQVEKFEYYLKNIVSGIPSLESLTFTSPDHYFLDSLTHDTLLELRIYENLDVFVLPGANLRYFDARKLPSLKRIHVPARLSELPRNMEVVHLHPHRDLSIESAANFREILTMRDSIKSVPFLNTAAYDHKIFKEFFHGNNVIESFSTQFTAFYDISHAFFAPSLTNLTIEMGHFPLVSFAAKQHQLRFLSMFLIKRFDLIWNTYNYVGLNVDFIGNSFENLSHIVEIASSSNTIQEFNLEMKTSIPMSLNEFKTLANVLLKLTRKKMTVNGYDVDRVLHDLRMLANETVNSGDVFIPLHMPDEKEFNEVEKLV